MRPLASAAALLLALASNPVLAQGHAPASIVTSPGKIAPVVGSVLERARLRAANVQRIDLHEFVTSSDSARFAVVLDGRPHLIRVRRHDVRAADFALLVDDGRSIRRLPTPTAMTYRGHVDAAAASVVAASIAPEGLYATVRVGGKSYGIEPMAVVLPGSPAGLHLVYRQSDVKVPSGISCEVLDSDARPVDAPRTSNASMCSIKLAEIAIDCDLEYYRLNGSSTSATQAAATRLVNATAAIYQSDVGIDYQITTILVRTARTYNNTDMRQLLPEFRSRWRSQHSGIRRDVAHLLTGKGGFSGIVGIAYLGVICGGSSYGVDKAFSGRLSTDVALLSHELGHNWNSPHCDANGPCHIMCAGLGGCTGVESRFGPFAINAISNHRNSRGCLTDAPPVGAPRLTAVTPSSVPGYPAANIRLSGDRLIHADQVTVGGKVAAFGKDPLTGALFVRMPSDLPLGAAPIRVRTCAGTSNTITVNVGGSHPSQLVVPPAIARVYVYDYRIITDRNWTGVLTMSRSPAPSAIPGFVNLSLGNGFQELFQVAVLGAGANGIAELKLAIPLSVSRGTVLYWQAITLDPNNVTVPLEASNRVRMDVVL